MHKSLVSFVATIGIPALVIWIFLISARIDGFIPNISWEVIFIPVYILLLSWLVFIIYFSREKIITHLVTFSWTLTWLLITAFIWMLISTLDEPNPAFSWTMVVGPLVVLLAISAIFEFTTLIGESFKKSWWKSNNPILERHGQLHILVFLVAEISILLFISLFGRKLDLLPDGPSWGVVFIPAWFGFAALFAILTTECAFTSYQVRSRQTIRRNKAGSLFTFFLTWLSLLVFMILLNVLLDFSDKISVWILFAPVFTAIVIFELYVCISKENFTSDEQVLTDYNNYNEEKEENIEFEDEE